MIKVAIIADDLTGANATGVQLVKRNLKVYTLINGNEENLKNIKGLDCVTYLTNSRGIDSNLAYERVYHGAMLLKSPHIKLFSKRIDSTLRGNMGKETDGILDALGDDVIALVVPCFPQAGRINKGGRLSVNGIPLHHTEAAADPKSSIDTDIVADIFAKQTKYKVASVYVEDLVKGPSHLSDLIAKYKTCATRIIIFDAQSEEDIDLIARGAVASKVKFVAVDPGPFTAGLCEYMDLGASTDLPKKVLAVVGSVNEVAAKQAARFLQTQKCHNVFIDVEAFLQNEKTRIAEIDRVASEVLERCNGYAVSSIIGSGVSQKNRINLGEYAKKAGCAIDDISSVINESIAKTAYKILSNNSGFKGLYTSGGDISVAVCNHLGASGMLLHNEVVPLASFGEIKGGFFDGLKYITKGGMVGDEDALSTCVDFLLNSL